ncbi:MAG: hypothetical protein ACXWGV_04100 [Solirubrobacterales bacterium]
MGTVAVKVAVPFFLFRVIAPSVKVFEGVSTAVAFVRKLLDGLKVKVAVSPSAAFEPEASPNTSAGAENRQALAAEPAFKPSTSPGLHRNAEPAVGVDYSGVRGPRAVVTYDSIGVSGDEAPDLHRDLLARAVVGAVAPGSDRPLRDRRRNDIGGTRDLIQPTVNSGNSKPHEVLGAEVGRNLRLPGSSEDLAANR